MGYASTLDENNHKNLKNRLARIAPPAAKCFEKLLVALGHMQHAEGFVSCKPAAVLPALGSLNDRNAVHLRTDQ